MPFQSRAKDFELSKHVENKPASVRSCCDCYIHGECQSWVLEMSETKQQTLNGHKQVQSKEVIAPYLSFQKKDFENSENASELEIVGGAFTTSKDLSRV